MARRGPGAGARAVPGRRSQRWRPAGAGCRSRWTGRSDAGFAPRVPEPPRCARRCWRRDPWNVRHGAVRAGGLPSGARPDDVPSCVSFPRLAGSLVPGPVPTASSSSSGTPQGLRSPAPVPSGSDAQVSSPSWRSCMRRLRIGILDLVTKSPNPSLYGRHHERQPGQHHAPGHRRLVRAGGPRRDPRLLHGPGGSARGAAAATSTCCSSARSPSRRSWRTR